MKNIPGAADKGAVRFAETVGAMLAVGFMLFIALLYPPLKEFLLSPTATFLHVILAAYLGVSMAR